MAKSEDTTPSIGLFILILFLILLMMLSSNPPEKEKELKDQLNEKKKALEVIVENIEESKAFRAILLADMNRTTVVLRWVVFGIMTAINIIMFFVLGYKVEIKEILECIALVNASIAIITSAILFLRYGEIEGIKSAYHKLQAYILKLRYDKTEEQIDAYLTSQLEDKEAISKEIQEIEHQLKQLEKSKIVLQTLNTAVIPPQN